MSISNVICTLIMGTRFHHGDSQFKRFMDLIDEGFKLFGSVALVNYIPAFRFLPFVQGVRNKIARNRMEMANFFQEKIDQHRATFNKDNIRDVVDNYLYEIQRAEEEGRDKELFQGRNPGEHRSLTSQPDLSKRTFPISSFILLRFPPDTPFRRVTSH